MAHLAAPRARGFLTLTLASVFDGVLFLAAPQYLVHDVCVWMRSNQIFILISIHHSLTSNQRRCRHVVLRKFIYLDFSVCGIRKRCLISWSLIYLKGTLQVLTVFICRCPPLLVQIKERDTVPELKIERIAKRWDRKRIADAQQTDGKRTNSIILTSSFCYHLLSTWGPWKERFFKRSYSDHLVGLTDFTWNFKLKQTIHELCKKQNLHNFVLNLPS